ncbi:imidazolonepropionase-like amidohydrolase [Kitasatospora sp. MAA4]|uniref:metal-dependent hydrolase family protein n=1 Tax=Kitasatospora sp. MAA4 TaxID=3035093 RepID=UPI00247471C9|nr:amidohydrolase family protein [Kitasatospora sp. MAA4]MDH6132410.1 imidazolonepropionase-like amidohydrolase [Kitasatospora sp. MAA4]
MKYYTADRLLTGDLGVVVPHAGVLVDGAVIRWAGPASQLPGGLRERAEPVPLGNRTLMPGLIDCHVHLALDGATAPMDRMRAMPDHELLALMLDNAADLLGAGVTTARDLGARGYLDVTVRDAIGSGQAAGPRMVVVGRPLTVSGGHCWFMGGECDTADDLRQLIRTQHDRGVDAVKIMLTGGALTPGSAPWTVQFTDHQLAAAVDEAHRLGQRVAAHAHGVEGIRQAVRAGVDTIEHCSFVTPAGAIALDGELADELAERRILVCPTISARLADRLDRLTADRRPALRALYERGVEIIAGTDAGTDHAPHRSFVGGLEVMARLGLPAAEILHSATARAARALDLDRVTGRIAAGLEADLIAVDGDPLQDVSALRRLDLILSRGRPVHSRLPAAARAK